MVVRTVWFWAFWGCCPVFGPYSSLVRFLRVRAFTRCRRRAGRRSSRHPDRSRSAVTQAETIKAKDVRPPLSRPSIPVRRINTPYRGDNST
uniref:Uncharacterized protein n=1 Tax=Streptomyces spiroverticillatus TaxID=67366 RepID=C0SMY0_9ACTN|nr:hypothetical protein [Streptomyces spiroverticillatus]